jgi:hypothetical protein
MKRDNLVVGNKVYRATMEVPIDATQQDYVNVTEYTVTKVGDLRYEVRTSGRGSSFGSTRGGMYRNNGEFLSALQHSPAEAVAYLELRMAVNIKEAKEGLRRLEARTLEHQKAIQEWRNTRGL